MVTKLLCEGSQLPNYLGVGELSVSESNVDSRNALRLPMCFRNPWH